MTDLNVNNVNEVFNQFLEIISKTIDTYTPLKLATRKQQKILRKAWISEEILTSIQHKQSLHKSFCIQGNIEQKTFYKKYANKLTKIRLIAKKLYHENKFRDTADNSLQLYNLLNDIFLSKKSSAPNVLNATGLEINNTADIANHLNSSLCKVGQTLADQIIFDPNDKNSVYYLGKEFQNQFL